MLRPSPQAGRQKGCLALWGHNLHRRERWRMYDRKKQIMERIQKLDEGSASPSGRYWCVTCKKMFRMEDPVCPYMTRMCVNTPIAVENIPPESSVWVEK